MCAVCTHLSVSGAARVRLCAHTPRHSTPLAARCVTLTRHTQRLSSLLLSHVSPTSTATHTKICTSTARLGEPGNIAQPISDLSYMKTCSDLVVRRGRGELHVACYQIWMNPLNVTLNLIRCSLRRRVQRRLHERAATPDFTDPIHSRLQALARTNRPAHARIHTGISGATGDEREASVCRRMATTRVGRLGTAAKSPTNAYS